MAFYVRKLRSRSARHRRIDLVFLRAAQTVLVVHSLWSLVIWTAERDVFAIRRVEVDGTRALSAARMEALARSELSGDILGLPFNNTLAAPRGEIAAVLRAESDRVARVSVIAKTHVLRVSVTERVPEFLWCSSRGHTEDDVASTTPPGAPQLIGCFFASSDGYIFASAPDYSGYPLFVYRTEATSTNANAATFPLGQYVLAARDHALVGDFLDELRRAGIAPREVIERGGGDYEITSDQAWRIMWASEMGATESVRRLGLVVRELDEDKKTDAGGESVSMIDLRFGNKVFYK